MTYSIGQVSKKTGISISAIRYYDNEGLLPFLKRKENGMRDFSERDLDHLELIECLKKTNMPIKDIKQFFEWYLAGDSTLKNRHTLFHQGKEAVEEEILKLETVLDTLKYKCWIYDIAVENGSLDTYKTIDQKDIPSDIKRYLDKKNTTIQHSPTDKIEITDSLS